MIKTSASGGTGKRLRGAFTLIELLVVIAIIAILNAMLAPAFSAAIDRANLETCQAHLREIGLACRIHFEDFGEYPPSLQTLYDQRYIDDDTILICPKTGARFFYRRPKAAASRSDVLASCVNPATSRGKRPHFFGDGFAAARVGGKVEVIRR